MNRIAFAAVAGAISIVIACLVFLGASRLAEIVTPMAVAHMRPIAFIIAPMMGTFSGLFVIFAGYRYRRSMPEEEPLKPRIRNGRIG